MECDCLPLTHLPHTTKLFAAFLEDFRRVADFYPHRPDGREVAAQAKRVKPEHAVRRSVLEILQEQNKKFGADGGTLRSLDRLESGAVAIVTGQQVGLFSGPAYSFYKALSAIHLARRLCSQGIEAVPVFWLGTEDHDLAEVNQSTWLGQDGLLRWELPVVADAIGRSVGAIHFDESAGATVEGAAGALSGPYSSDVRRALSESYRPGETFGSAFGKLMARLLAGREMVLLDPLDVRLHRLAADVYIRAAEDAAGLAEALLERSKALTARGFHAQVRVTRETTLLFSSANGARQGIHLRRGKFAAGERMFDRDELIDAIAKSPESFTPNVLLRPVVQDALLPTAAYVAGPAEIAYFAQAAVVYEHFKKRMPVVLPRASFTLLGSRVERLLAKYKLGVAEVLRGRQHLRQQMARQGFAPGLIRRFERDEKSLLRLLKVYSKPLGRLDRTLIGALDTAERKMLYQLQKLREKTGRAANFRSGVLDRHEKILLDSLFPHRGLQERTLCFLPFLAEYGPELLAQLAERASPGSRNHQVIRL